MMWNRLQQKHALRPDCNIRPQHTVPASISFARQHVVDAVEAARRDADSLVDRAEPLAPALLARLVGVQRTAEIPLPLDPLELLGQARLPVRAPPLVSGQLGIVMLAHRWPHSVDRGARGGRLTRALASLQCGRRAGWMGKKAAADCRTTPAGEHTSRPNPRWARTLGREGRRTDRLERPAFTSWRCPRARTTGRADAARRYVPTRPHTTNQTSGRSAARPPSHENPSEQHLWQPIYPCPGAPRAATGEQSDQGDHRHPRSEHSGVAAGQGSPERSICGRLERNPTPERQKRAVSDGRRAFEAQSRARGRDEGVHTSRRAGTEAERSPTAGIALRRWFRMPSSRARPFRSVAVESAALNLHGVNRRRTWHSR